MSGDGWTDTMIADLRSMRAKGISFGQIGKHVGKTRSACVGKAHRLKLPVIDAVKPPRRLPKPAGLVQRRALLDEGDGGAQHMRDARDLEILTRLDAGETMDVVSRSMAVSVKDIGALVDEVEAQS